MFGLFNYSESNYWMRQEQGIYQGIDDVIGAATFFPNQRLEIYSRRFCVARSETGEIELVSGNYTEAAELIEKLEKLMPVRNHSHRVA